MTVAIHADPVPLRIDADGTLRIGGTRVTLDVIVAQYADGASAEAIAKRFDVLSPADVHSAIGYYLRHREELDRYLAQRERESDALLRSLSDRHQRWESVSRRLQERVNGEDARGPQVSGG